MMAQEQNRTNARDSVVLGGEGMEFHQPEQWEAMYRKDKAGFRERFFAQYPRLVDNPESNLLARSWHARLMYRPERVRVPLQERMVIVGAAALSGFLLKLPEWAGFAQDEYMIRYFPFMILPFLIGYMLWKRGADRRKVSVNLAGIAGFVLYMSFLPFEAGSDVLPLVMMHMLLVLWFLLGSAYDRGPGLTFLRMNGDVVVAAAVLGLAGGLLTMISFGLFSLTPIDVEQFFESYVVFWGGPSVVLGAFFLAETKPGLVSRVAPVIARIFTPVAAVVLFLFLMAFLFTDVDLYSDRSVLFVFNLMLIAVMALTLFSLANESPDVSDVESGDGVESGWFQGAQLLLIGLAIVIGSLALSAIVYRVFQFGFTPNRTIVLGSNLLVLLHLTWIGGVMVRNLGGAVRGGGGVGSGVEGLEHGEDGTGSGIDGLAHGEECTGRDERVVAEQVIVRFLPVYFFWAVGVVFLLPLLF